MLKYIDGDIFEQDVQAIVNPVNCLGVSGKGLALEFKKRYTHNFKRYKHYCDHEGLNIGEFFATKDKGKIIINFATKGHWRDRSYIDDIDDGLVDLLRFIKDYKIKSIAIPPLGCGLGGLQWHDFKRSVDSVFSYVKGVNIIVLRPQEY